MTVKERLKYYAKTKEKSVRAFEINAGIGIGYINAIRVSIQSDKMQSIASHYPDLNRDWLLYGEGEMLKNLSQTEITNHTKDSDTVSMPADVWNVIKNQAESLKTKDAQTSELIELLKEQMKKSYHVEHQFRAVNLVVEEE